MKKHVILYIVIVLNLIGLKSYASLIDQDVNLGIRKISSDDHASDNEGVRRCGSMRR